MGRRERKKAKITLFIVKTNNERTGLYTLLYTLSILSYQSSLKSRLHLQALISLPKSNFELKNQIKNEKN